MSFLENVLKMDNQVVGRDTNDKKNGVSRFFMKYYPQDSRNMDNAGGMKM